MVGYFGMLTLTVHIIPVREKSEVVIKFTTIHVFLDDICKSDSVNGSYLLDPI